MQKKGRKKSNLDVLVDTPLVTVDQIDADRDVVGALFVLALGRFLAAAPPALLLATALLNIYVGSKALALRLILQGFKE